MRNSRTNQLPIFPNPIGVDTKRACPVAGKTPKLTYDKTVSSDDIALTTDRVKHLDSFRNHLPEHGLRLAQNNEGLLRPWLFVDRRSAAERHRSHAQAGTPGREAVAEDRLHPHRDSLGALQRLRGHGTKTGTSGLPPNSSAATRESQRPSGRFLLRCCSSAARSAAMPRLPSGRNRSRHRRESARTR